MGNVSEDIERYLRGQMSPAEMHALEKRALHDPFLADALEGGSTLPPDEFASDTKSLENRINRRVAGKRTGVKWYYQAAAALLLGASAVLVYMLARQEQSVTPITMNTQEESKLHEESVPLADTIAAAEPEQDDVADGEALSTPAEPGSSGTPEASSAARAERPDVQPPPASTDASDEREIMPREPTDTGDGREATIVLHDTAEAQHFARKDARGRQALQPQSAGPVREILAEKAVEVKGQTIRGKVTDIDDGIPLPGVNVIEKGSGVGTVTDLNGNYELTIPANAQSLVFSFIGLQSREVYIPAGSDSTAEVDIQLEQDVAALSEVVVVGYGTEEDFEFEGTKWEPAEPAGGKREFKKYLENEVRYPEIAIENKVEGKVTIQFTIEPTGTLTDFKVVRSLGYGCDEEVIRLISEGPQWKPTKRNDEPVRGKGKVKLRFALPNDKK